MLSRLPDLVGNSESDDVDTVDRLEDFVGLPHDVTSESESDSDDAVSEYSVESSDGDGEPSPDDQDGAGEEDRPVVVLRPSLTYTSCCACGRQASVAVLGTPEATSLFDALLHTEKLNLLCTSCGESIDPLNSRDERE